MAKFRKISEIIEAVQFDGQEHPWPDCVKPWSEAGYQPRDMSWGYIVVLGEKQHVCTGDWIVTGAQGERYRCTDDIFSATYEPVADGK